jgi:hypothetical protein
MSENINFKVKKIIFFNIFKKSEILCQQLAIREFGLVIGLRNSPIDIVMALNK